MFTSLPCDFLDEYILENVSPETKVAFCLIGYLRYIREVVCQDRCNK